MNSQEPFLKKVINNVKGYLHSTKMKYSKFKFIQEQKKLDDKVIAKVNKDRKLNFSQFKHLPKILSRTEKLAIKIAGYVILFSILFLGYYNVFVNTNVIPKFGGSYTEGLVGSPLYLNPLLAQTNDVDQDLTRLLFNGLVRFNENYEVIPDLAESWKISEDKKQYSFKIKDNVKWHDGDKLTANDVLFTFQSIKDKNFKSPLNITFEGVTAEITGENEITFKLQEPYAGFLTLMTFGILPQHLWYDVPANNSQLATYNIKPIGTGPYKFKSFIKDKTGTIISYTFEANEDYHLQKPYIKTLTFKFYSDINTAIEALKNKNVQGLGFLPKEFNDKISEKLIKVYNINLSQFTSIFFNSDKNSLLKNSIVKKALTLAINKDEILSEILQNQGNVIHAPILPGFTGYDPQIKDEYSPSKAAETLTADGWALTDVEVNPDGTIKDKKDKEKTDETNTQEPIYEKILTKKGTPLQITLTTIDKPDSVKLVNLIKDFWEQIGVKVNIKTVDKLTFTTTTLPSRDYEALVYGGISGYDTDLFSFWHSSQRDFPGVNLSNYVNRKADDLIESIRQISDPIKKEEKLKELQKIILKDQPAIFLYSPTYSYPVINSVKGINISRINLPSDRFWNVNKWYIKTKKLFK